MIEDDFDVTDAGQFERALCELLRRAYGNDVPVSGGWQIDGGDGHPEWDVVVTVVDRADDD